MAPKTATGKGKKPVGTSGSAPPPSAFTVEHPSTPIPQRGAFGANGAQEAEPDFLSPLMNVPAFVDRNEEELKLLSEPSTPTFRRWITDAPLESVNRDQIIKPVFLFGDDAEDPDLLDLGSYKWLRVVNSRYMFLPAMERDCSLTSLRAVSTPRKMNWDLTPTQDGVMCGRFSRDGAQVDRHGHHVTGLQPGLFQRELPVGESAVAANTFGRAFHKAEGQFPAKDFRTPGWSRWGPSQWWPRITEYILEEYRDELERFGLRAPIRATQLGLRNNSQQFLGILELYNPDTHTFFTPDGELGIALHEMAEISGLPHGRYPYEEYIPGYKELTDLERDHPQVVETYWEVMCHYHICTCRHGRADKKGEKSISHSIWAHYLFEGLDDKKGTVVPLGPLEAGALSRLVLGNLPMSYVTNTDEHGFPEGTTFDTYLYQSGEPISSKAVLAGYLMLWLKHIVIPAGSFDLLASEVIFPAVCLAHGRQYALLPAMIARIHCGLRRLCYAFCHGAENPRVELPYAYLMAWFVMHCPTLMGTPSAHVEGQVTPFIQRLENVDWTKHYMASVRRALRDYKSYSFNRCLPHFPGVSYGQALVDEPNAQGYTTLSLGCFLWLMSIRPGYFVCRFGPICVAEPYLPCRFARQFGYDQLYVGNPNPQLQSDGCGLVVGARAWYWTVAGGTGARFSLPQRDPQSRTTFAYCKWHCMANAEIPGFNINSSGLRLIRGRYREGQTSTRSRIPGLKEYLHAETDAGTAKPQVDVEPSRQSSPHGTQEPSRQSSPHETQADIDEALDEYGSNISSSAGFEETPGAEPVSEAPGDFVPFGEPLEHIPEDPLESSTSPSQSVGAVPQEATPTSEPGGSQALVPTTQGSKRPGPPRTKRVAKRVRREGLIEAATSLSPITEGPPDAAKSMPGDAEESPAVAIVSESEPRTRDDDSAIPAAVVPETSLALTVATTPSIEVPPIPSSACPSGSNPSAGTPSSFDLSKEYGVSMIRHNFLTILKESPAQVLERGGDFAGIKAVLEPLLDVMQSLTNATATLPYRTYLVQAETLFNRWQRQRDQSLRSMIEDRAMQLRRIRDDTQFELQRQLLEKKQSIGQLFEKATSLYDEKKRVAGVERNQQLLVDSYKAALVDIQAKLAEAESGLAAATEKHQTLIAQCAEHEAAVQAESNDLDGLSAAVSQMPVLSDDDLHKQATEEVKVAHKETMVKIATEIRQTLGNL